MAYPSYPAPAFHSAEAIPDFMTILVAGDSFPLFPYSTPLQTFNLYFPICDTKIYNEKSKPIFEHLSIMLVDIRIRLFKQLAVLVQLVFE